MCIHHTNWLHYPTREGVGFKLHWKKTADTSSWMENESRKLAKIIMILTGEKIIVNSNVQNIESFLIDSNNIEKLLPTDKVSNFESDQNACSFKVQGGITISLVQDGKENGKI